MSFERAIILTKLRAFLTGEITQTELYEWGLFVAVSADYEELIKNDHLSEQVMKFVLDLIHPKTKTFPVRQAVQYFIDCLEDRKKFDLEEFKMVSGEKVAAGVSPAPTIKNTSSAATPKVSVSHPGIQLILKIYLLIFVVLSLGFHAVILMKPDIFASAEESLPAFSEIVSASLPHLFYATAMIIALFVRMSWGLFYVNFFVSTLGMFYYWYFTIDYVYKHNLPLTNFMMICPLIALPPTAGFFLMLNRWFEGETRELIQLRRKTS